MASPDAPRALIQYVRAHSPCWIGVPSNPHLPGFSGFVTYFPAEKIVAVVFATPGPGNPDDMTRARRPAAGLAHRLGIGSIRPLADVGDVVRRQDLGHVEEDLAALHRAPVRGRPIAAAPRIDTDTCASAPRRAPRKAGHHAGTPPRSRQSFRWPASSR
jgi:hypothetical protein